MNNNNKNTNRYGGISWALILILAILGVWWLALPLLFIKLFSTPSSAQKKEAPSLKHEDTYTEKLRKKEVTEEKVKKTVKKIFEAPSDGKLNYILLIVFGIILILFSLILLAALADGYDAFLLVMFLTNLIGGGAMTAKGFLMKKAIARYAAYKAIIGMNKAMEVSTLAKKVGVKERRVEKDLQKMIENGYFGEGAYINKELGYFFVDSAADAELNEAMRAAHEKTAEVARQEAARQSASVYEQFLTQIRDVNDRIPGKEMSQKIYRIEDITREIFRIVQEEPEKRAKIDRFMKYFLPTTLKLLETYATLEKSPAEGENINQSRRSIEIAMDTIVDGFQNQLDQLYKTDALNIETEIDVLTQMMNQEKSGTSSEFNIKKPAAQGSGSVAAQAAQQK